jgi:hypothetical protein
MDLTDYPKEALQKIGGHPTFPRLILYGGEGDVVIWRSYQECGCFRHFSGPNDAVTGQCVIHGGSHRCFWDRPRQNRELKKMLEDYDLQLALVQGSQKRARRLLQRDKSPERA